MDAQDRREPKISERAARRKKRPIKVDRVESENDSELFENAGIARGEPRAVRRDQYALRLPASRKKSEALETYSQI